MVIKYINCEREAQCSYNSYMLTVNVAVLKNQLSAYLLRVRNGEELLIRDRNLPIAKIVPLRHDEVDLDEMSLVASGQISLPKKPFQANRFWSIGAGAEKSQKVKSAINKAIAAEREERHVRLLGHQRRSSHLRTRPGR